MFVCVGFCPPVCVFVCVGFCPPVCVCVSVCTLSRHSPFAVPDIYQRTFSEAFHDFVAKCLSYNPQDRSALPLLHPLSSHLFHTPSSHTLSLSPLLPPTHRPDAGSLHNHPFIKPHKNSPDSLLPDLLKPVSPLNVLAIKHPGNHANHHSSSQPPLIFATTTHLRNHHSPCQPPLTFATTTDAALETELEQLSLNTEEWD